MSSKCRTVFAAAFSLLGSLGVASASEASFVRGDSDRSGRVDIGDAIQPLYCLFIGFCPNQLCQDAADADDNGELQLTDAIRILSFLFLGGQPPAQPFPECGYDATNDFFGCVSYPPCEELTEFETVVQRFTVIDTLAGKGLTEDDNGWKAAFEGAPATDCELSAPHNAQGDVFGNVYIADKEAHAIRKVTPDGKIFTVAGTNEPGDGSDEPGLGVERALQNPNGIHVRPDDGTVFILDLDNEKVRRLAPDGTLTTMFKTPGLTLGRGLWVSHNEDLAYVASSSRLLRWTPADGDTAAVFAENFVRLGNLTVNDLGEVLATDQDANVVYKVHGDSSREVIAGNGTTSGGGDGALALETGLNGVRGIWLLPGAGYYLATHAGSQVWYVDTEGIIHLVLNGSPGAHTGDGMNWNDPSVQVSEVRNISLDPFGNLLITEHDAGFIRIVQAGRS